MRDDIQVIDPGIRLRQGFGGRAIVTIDHVMLPGIKQRIDKPR